MSRTLSMIVAAGCIALGPALTAEAKPAPRPKHTPVVQQTAEIDYSTLPPEARKMLQQFFAERQTQATQPRHAVRANQRFQRSQGRTVGQPTTFSSHDFDTSKLTPEARRMLQAFFETRGQTTVVPGKFSYLPGGKAPQVFARAGETKSFKTSCPTVGFHSTSTWSWAENPAQRTQAIRAIGESILWEAKQSNRRFRTGQRRTSQAHHPAS
ncbi:MAG: hypothetical protein ACF8NJ_07215 [Phycisphaerales bacterium JB038]